MGLGDGLADDRARRALAERLVDEAMAIGRLALHRDEQVAARHFAAVERPARNGEGRRSDAPRGLSNLFGGPEVSHSPPSIRFERSREPLRIPASTLAGDRKRKLLNSSHYC